jgi:soluble lytic murein transglycosylase-like protein
MTHMKLVAPGLLAAVLIVGQGRAHAAPSYDRCFDQAGDFYTINADLLRAIARIESGGNPAVVNRNANGSEDVGLMQINSWWLPRLAAYGISREHLFEACVNISVGAWILHQEIKRHGRTWKSVGHYNAKTPSKARTYGERVFRIWQKSRVQ